jgi:protein-L-isoaspartate(D-aspartate) O-methyltransferase
MRTGLKPSEPPTAATPAAPRHAPGASVGECAEARRRMVRDQLVARAISDAAVLEAMATVPRERFVPAELAASAYDDRALPAGLGQTISQPYIVAYMTECLHVARDHRVLEVGTGTGYQTAVLARLVREVHTIERLDLLLDAARVRLRDVGADNVRFRLGDGSMGWPEAAPFDRIIVTAAAPTLVPALLEQLAVGGRMLLPVGPDERQVLVAVDKLPGRYVETPLLPVVFVRLVGQAGFAAG